MHRPRCGALAARSVARGLFRLRLRAGLADDDVLQKAYSENWILITNDKDFGEKVHRDNRPHHGVIFLRLGDERAAAKIATLARLLDAYDDRLRDAFVVVTETHVRFRRA